MSRCEDWTLVWYGMVHMVRYARLDKARLPRYRVRPSHHVPTNASGSTKGHEQRQETSWCFPPLIAFGTAWQGADIRRVLERRAGGEVTDHSDGTKGVYGAGVRTSTGAVAVIHFYCYCHIGKGGRRTTVDGRDDTRMVGGRHQADIKRRRTWMGLVRCDAARVVQYTLYAIRVINAFATVCYVGLG